jgi:hypothetical protein
MRWKTLLAAAVAAVLFVATRWPLLHGDGAVHGTNVDTSIIALMGRQWLNGGGLDVFTWGALHLGPLTSMITAGWAVPLLALQVEWPWPLAVRLAAMAEMALGAAMLAWAAARVDRRAGAALLLLLAVGPPVLLRMSLFPLGHEMAFLLGAAILAIVSQHWTAEPGRGWLTRWPGRAAFGVLCGIGWWMNRTIAPVLAGALLIAILRSDFFARVRPSLGIRDRLLLRPRKGVRMNGIVQALLFVVWWSGVLLLVIQFTSELVDRIWFPFLTWPLVDGLLLAAAAQLGWLITNPPAVRLRDVTLEPLREIAPVLAGIVVGMSPAWIATYIRPVPYLYESGTPLHLSLQTVWRDIRWYGPRVPSDLGFDPTPAGMLCAVLFAVAAISGLRHHRREVRAFFTLTPGRWSVRAAFAAVLLATALSTLLVQNALHVRYMLVGVATISALGVFEVLRWWDTRQPRLRALAALTAGVWLVTFATSALIHRVRSVEPRIETVPLAVEHARRLDCRVTYANRFLAPAYRLLDDERTAWIAYIGIDLTPQYSEAAKRRPGRRCYMTDESFVFPLPGDLPAPRKGRPVPTLAGYRAQKFGGLPPVTEPPVSPPARPSAALPPDRPPAAR